MKPGPSTLPGKIFTMAAPSWVASYTSRTVMVPGSQGVPLAAADLGHLGRQAGLHHEVGPGGNEPLGVSGRVNRADAQQHIRAVVAHEGHQLLEHVEGLRPAVGELKHAQAALVAGLHNPLGVRSIGVVEHRHHGVASTVSRI